MNDLVSVLIGVNVGDGVEIPPPGHYGTDKKDRHARVKSRTECTEDKKSIIS